jgi:hypothetical protein
VVKANVFVSADGVAVGAVADGAELDWGGLAEAGPAAGAPEPQPERARAKARPAAGCRPDRRTIRYRVGSTMSS